MRINSICSAAPQLNCGQGRKNVSFQESKATATKTAVTAAAGGASVFASIRGFFKDLFSSENVPDDVPETNTYEKDMIDYYSRVMG